MQAIRQLINIQQLKGIVDIPEYFTGNQVEIFIFPVIEDSKLKSTFHPENFFGLSHVDNIDKHVEAMRNEWMY